MNLMLFLVKFIKFKQRIKFKKFELHNYAKLWLALPPTNLSVLLTHCGQSILRKISKFDATTNQILRLKCTKLDFRWRSAPDPTGGAYSAPPDPVSVFQAAYFLQEEREGKRKEAWVEREGE